MGAGTRASSLRASSRNWVGSRPTRAGRRNPATRLVTGALRAHNPSIPSIRGDQSRVSCPGTAPALTHETRCARREIQTEDHHFSQQKHVRAAPRTPGDQRARPLGRRRRTHGERSEQSYREHTHGAENFLWPDLLMCGILTLERPWLALVVGALTSPILERFSFRLDIFLRSCCPPLKVPVKLSFRGDVGRAQMCLNSVWVSLQPHISANTPRWATISAAVWTACSRRTHR